MIQNQYSWEAEKHSLCQLMKAHYGFRTVEIRKTKGGFSALAYLVTDGRGERFFLKVYDRRRAGAARWIDAIPYYTPILKAMGEFPVLQGRVPEPVMTLQGAPACMDEFRTCLLYRFIEGASLQGKQFTQEKLHELMGIIAAVHRFSVPEQLCNSLARERFALPFAEKLEELIQAAPGEIMPEEKKSRVRFLLEHARKLGDQMMPLPYVLCHGDIHRGNLMDTAHGLVLIDWDGMCFAPPEADLFFFQRCQAQMNAVYRDLCGCVPNPMALEFFGVRRRLEDIYEFLVPLLAERISKEDDKLYLRYLKNELERLSLPMEFDFL